MADIEHSAIPDSGRHEPKGASTAAEDTVLKSNGDGSTTFEKVNYSEILGAPASPVEQGWWIYEDVTTSSTDIDLTTAGTDYTLTNDGEGSGTNDTYALDGIAPIWNVITNRFNFSNLSLGDTVDIQVDLDIVTGASNHAIDVDLEIGVGGTTYTIPIITDMNIKTATTTRIIGFVSVPIKDANTKDNPARIIARSDSTGDSIVVNNWYVRALSNG